MVKDIAAANYWLKQWFPHLNRKNALFRVTSPRDESYNCIAWAMGLNDRWVDTDEASGHWWPVKYSDVSSQKSKEGLIRAFQTMGFKECDNDNTEKHFDKVALYYNPITNEWTHAARVISPNEYHSKAGKAWDFHHGPGDALTNINSPSISYGNVYTFMKRPKLYRVISLYHRFSLVRQKFMNELRTW